MHQSGHSREHFQQTVQFSSLRAITPRVRGGRFGFSSGYSWGMERWSMCFSVTPRPLISPDPGSPRLRRDPLARAAPGPPPPPDPTDLVINPAFHVADI